LSKFIYPKEILGYDHWKNRNDNDVTSVSFTFILVQRCSFIELCSFMEESDFTSGDQ